MHSGHHSLVVRQPIEQFGMSLETRNQSSVFHAMPLHDIREHDFMRRFRNGYGRGHAVHTAQFNPLEQVRTVVGQHRRIDEVIVENRGVEVADNPVRDSG